MRNDLRVESASSFHHKYKSRNFSSNSSAISLALRAFRMFRPIWSRWLPKLHSWRYTWLHGLHATTLVPGRRITFFRLLLSSSKLCSNWQLTACCLQLPACTLNAKLTISSCQIGTTQIQTHAHRRRRFWWEGETPRKKKNWSRLLFTPFLPLCFSFFCSLRLVLLFELFKHYFSKLFRICLHFYVVDVLLLWHLVVVCLFYQLLIISTRFSPNNFFPF